MAEFSSSRSGLFNRFVEYRTICGLWNQGYELNLLYFDRYCSDTFPGVHGLTQEMIDGWCMQRGTESRNSLIGRTLPARKLVEYLNARDLVSLGIPEMPSLMPRQYIPHSFTGEELANFFNECDRLVLSAKNTSKKFRALEMAVLFRLIYSSGLRTTEARLLLLNGILKVAATTQSPQIKISRQKPHLLQRAVKNSTFFSCFWQEI